MEDEENEKTVDTQTTDSVENQNDSTQTMDDQGNGQNLGDTQEQQADEKSKKDENISKAFGNTTDKTKSEAEKGKKTNSIAKTNEDGSITFKNQEELNGFIDRMYRKGANNGQNSKQNQGEEQKSDNNNSQEKEESEQEVENTNETSEIQDKSAEIALALIDADIDPKKARRASKLIDANKVVINGVLDTAKLNEEIKGLLAEWPELKSKAPSEVQNGVGFKFGASKEQQDSSDSDAISEIFGNKRN